MEENFNMEYSVPENITASDVEQLLEVQFPIEPLYNKIIITLNRDEDIDGVVLNDAGLSESQYVIAVGTHTKLKPGEKVLLDLKKMSVKGPSADDNVYDGTSQIELDPIEVDGVVYAFVEDRMIKAKDYR